MNEPPLYQQIAESIRRDILEGRYAPGDRLPSVRQLHQRWNCTPGTIQRAYQELARQGLVESRAGQGTRVTAQIPSTTSQLREALRKAQLIHRMETVILEAISGGYAPEEIQQALNLGLDRWRAVQPAQQAASSATTLRFVGSHDLALVGLSEAFELANPDIRLDLAFSGSLGGLIALAEGRADLAGCHLWDQETDRYNQPFICKILPGRSLVGITLAHRRLGLITAPGNPLNLRELSDLARPGVRFINRQPGSGTRVWLDAMLARQGVTGEIRGYTDERLTHTDVARAVAEAQADVGLGLEAAASAFGMEFTLLARERYDLVMPSEVADRPAGTALLNYLASPEARKVISRYPGYESDATGVAIDLSPDCGD